MSDLYTFNKRSNHVQFFKWLWGVDPTHRYKTMCPYFWSYVVTILILPFLILIRVFGTWGQDFNKWMLTYRQEQIAKKKKEFLENSSMDFFSASILLKLLIFLCRLKTAFKLQALNPLAFNALASNSVSATIATLAPLIVSSLKILIEISSKDVRSSIKNR